VTKGFAGWKTPTHEVEAFSDLPAEARELISFIEDFVDKPVDIVSVGRDTNQIIIRRNPWIGY
jgi:adenylosuccinate synthase